MFLAKIYHNPLLILNVQDVKFHPWVCTLDLAGTLRPSMFLKWTLGWANYLLEDLLKQNPNFKIIF